MTNHTTILGILAIAGGIIAAATQYFTGGGFGAVKWGEVFTAITAGVGLIFAKNFNVSNSPTPGPSVQATGATLIVK